VEHAEGARSTVLLHLSFLGDQPETHGGTPAADLQQWLDDALASLERVVTTTT
jgi:hypothetical protein